MDRETWKHGLWFQQNLKGNEMRNSNWNHRASYSCNGNKIDMKQIKYYHTHSQRSNSDNNWIKKNKNKTPLCMMFLDVDNNVSVDCCVCEINWNCLNFFVLCKAKIVQRHNKTILHYLPWCALNWTRSICMHLYFAIAASPVLNLNLYMNK